MRYAFLFLFFCWGCSGGLSDVDVGAMHNQQAAAVFINNRLEGLDAGSIGAIRTLDEGIFCSAGGVLRRAGQPTSEAGIPCPTPQQ